VYTHSLFVAQGVDTELHILEGVGHGFLLDHDLTQSREVYSVTVKFFDTISGPEFGEAQTCDSHEIWIERRDAPDNVSPDKFALVSHPAQILGSKVPAGHGSTIKPTPRARGSGATRGDDFSISMAAMSPLKLCCSSR
jgi:hypothetical protein